MVSGIEKSHDMGRTRLGLPRTKEKPEMDKDIGTVPLADSGDLEL